jgi:hypothetical protein
MPEQNWDEKAAITEIITQFQKLAKPLEAVSKLKPGDAEALIKLEAAMKSLTGGTDFGHALDEIVGRAQAVLDEACKMRVQAFGRLETAFIKAVETEGKSVRELDNGWRIGGLELQVEREQSRARILVNREVVLNWAPIQGPDDLPKLVNTANALLEKAALPEQELAGLFYAAYEVARDARRRQGLPAFHRVPALQLYREFFLTLVRREVEANKPGKKIGTVELPLWAFLYNLDRYRALGAAVPEELRLSMETGSQKEVAQGMGLVINGLDARRDYQVICYIVPVKG